MRPFLRGIVLKVIGEPEKVADESFRSMGRDLPIHPDFPTSTDLNFSLLPEYPFRLPLVLQRTCAPISVTVQVPLHRLAPN